MKNNPERNRERASEWYEDNREKALETRRAYYRNNKHKWKKSERTPEQKRQDMLKHRYSMTNEQYNALLKKQNSACAICFSKQEILHVDHNHKCCSTRKTCGNCVRGLLCARCNKALGLFQDDEDILLKAIKYLQ
jgi:hypothetical protein